MVPLQDAMAISYGSSGVGIRDFEKEKEIFEMRFDFEKRLLKSDFEKEFFAS